MKKKIITYDRFGPKEKEIEYIPVRFIIALALILLETAAVIAVTCLCAIYIPYFYLLMWATEIFCVLKIVNSDENPDYKIPWLLLTLAVPVAGFMIYLMFYDRKLTKKQMKRIYEIGQQKLSTADNRTLAQLETEDKKSFLQAKLLCRLSGSHLYQNTDAEYYGMGERMYPAMLDDLKKAEKFIFLEYFIIEEGIFWNSILDILKEKAARGVEVRVVYDDIGCMRTLPGDYCKTLRSFGISAVCFSRLKGQADNEFNNRSHRKILIIDGKVGYTGGINIADEYINKIQRFGVWKDTGIRLEGDAVAELTRIFLGDYELNVKTPITDFSRYFNDTAYPENKGYVIPFADGPSPMFRHRVAKTMLLGMLNQAQDYVYMTSPYLIIDNELCQAMENAAMRGIDVRIVTPHIPDKKIVFLMTRSYYKRLTDAGVRIYEYEPGFIHAKGCLSDDQYAIVGTINLDYRSLVHHFENGIWLYGHEVLPQIKNDMLQTIGESIEMTGRNIPDTLAHRLIRAVVRIFSPML